MNGRPQKLTSPCPERGSVVSHTTCRDHNLLTMPISHKNVSSFTFRRAKLPYHNEMTCSGQYRQQKPTKSLMTSNGPATRQRVRGELIGDSEVAREGPHPGGRGALSSRTIHTKPNDGADMYLNRINVLCVEATIASSFTIKVLRCDDPN